MRFPPRGLAARAMGAALATVLAVTGAAPTAGAISGGAGATGSGDTIISTILSGGVGRSRAPAPPSDAPLCLWRTLTDEEVLFLIHVAAAMPQLLDAALFDALDEVVPGAPGSAPGSWDVQVKFCDGVPQSDHVRTVVTPVPGDDAEAVARHLLTRRSERRLPAPLVSISPPHDEPAVIGEPVFFSIPTPALSSEIHDSITAGGRRVEVWANPARISVAPGEAGHSALQQCDGFGRPFDPDPAAPSAGAQSRDPAACVLRYSRATGVDGRRGFWLGYVRLDWDASYRVDDGPVLPLDGLFSYTLFERSVREVHTVIRR